MSKVATFKGKAEMPSPKSSWVVRKNCLRLVTDNPMFMRSDLLPKSNDMSDALLHVPSSDTSIFGEII